MILVVGARHFEANGRVQLPLEWRDVAMGGPELELRIAAGVEARQVVRPTREEINAAERLRVAPIEPLREPHDRGQYPNDGPLRPP